MLTASAMTIAASAIEISAQANPVPANVATKLSANAFSIPAGAWRSPPMIFSSAA
jgi:hypothetical protein